MLERFWHIYTMSDWNGSKWEVFIEGWMLCEYTGNLPVPIPPVCYWGMLYRYTGTCEYRYQKKWSVVEARVLQVFCSACCVRWWIMCFLALIGVVAVPVQVIEELWLRYIPVPVATRLMSKTQDFFNETQYWYALGGRSIFDLMTYRYRYIRDLT